MASSSSSSGGAPAVPEEEQQQQPAEETVILQAARSGHLTAMKDTVLGDPAALLATTPEGNTCLHIACMKGHTDFCDQVVAIKGSLLAAVNMNGETPLIIAVQKGHVPLASQLLRWCRLLRMNEAVLKQDKDGCNALHHAIILIHKHKDDANNGPRKKLALELIEAEPALSRGVNKANESPMFLAVRSGGCSKEVLEKLVTIRGSSNMGGQGLKAAIRGQVNAAQEILERCPDTPYATQSGKTCLHQAVQLEFVNFIIRSPQLRKLVNTRDENGLTALHLSVTYCRPKMLRALLRHSDIDVTMLDRQGYPPTWLFGDAIKNAKSLHWNEVSMLLLSADPKRETNIYNLHKEIKDTITDRSRKNVKPLTETYTRNTSIVAILMASITFAAAFTLSGWYRNNDAAASRGPKKSAFQAFLIFDILAMCCSLSVAFICVIARWEDFEFLLYYRSATVKIMWLAYVATIAAFATGLYTVLGPQLPRAAIAICCLPVLVPSFTWVLGKWHVLKLQLRLGRKFKSDLLDMV